MAKAKLTTSQFIFKAIQIHGNKYDYSKVIYSGTFQKVEIICKIHGSFMQTPSNHLNKFGCIKCANNYRSDTETFITKSNIIHKQKFIYNKVKYVNNITKVIIICPIHGEFEQTPANHLSGFGCPICCASKGELKIRHWLKDNSITFKEQFKFTDCKNERPLPFDFYLPDYNTCIEFDGRQHFKPHSFNKDSSEQTKNNNLHKVQKHDEIKNLYCKINNIKLIRISYKILDIDKLLYDSLII